jgi:RimJ/RimL family protein N-acetyltransferase
MRDESSLQFVTSRLVLRDLEASDTESVFNLYSSWEVSQHLNQISWPYTRSLADTFVRRAIEERGRQSAFFFAIETRDSSRFVGIVVVRADEESEGLGILGYSILPEFWGQGFATEAGRRILDFAFFGLGLDAVQATPVLSNPASVRVLVRLGFKAGQRGVLEESLHSGKRLADRYAITKGEFGKRESSS